MMPKPEMPSRELRLLTSIRNGHEEICRKFEEKGTYRIECPRCGASLLTQKDATKALCPGCGNRLPVQRLVADKAVALMGLPQTSHAQLLEAGSAALQREDWKGAEQFFSRACQAAPRDGDAWQGLVLALTQRFSKMEDTHPEQIEAVAEQMLGDRGPALAAQWQRYLDACRSYRCTQERLEQERRQARREAKEQAKRDRRQAAKTRREERRRARNDPDRKRARMNVLSVVLTAVGIGLFFVFASLGSGFFFIFLLGGLGLFGGNRRRRR